MYTNTGANPGVFTGSALFKIFGGTKRDKYIFVRPRKKPLGFLITT